MAAARLGKLVEMAERLKFADFVWAAGARLGKLAVVAILNSGGLEREAVRLRSDSFKQVVVRPGADGFGQTMAGLNTDGRVQEQLM